MNANCIHGTPTGLGCGDCRRELRLDPSKLNPGSEYGIAAGIYRDKLQAGEPLRDGALWRECVNEALMQIARGADESKP